MKLNSQIVAVLLLGAWAAMIVQADARTRGGKHPSIAAGHVGTHHPAGVASGRRNASPATPAAVRNAIGVVTRPAVVGAGGSTKGTSAGANPVVVKPNPPGTHAGTTALTPSLPAGAGRIGTTTNPVNAVRAVPSVATAHAGGINGTGMARRGNTLGTIGGPARVATGITGTGIQKKK